MVVRELGFGSAREREGGAGGGRATGVGGRSCQVAGEEEPSITFLCFLQVKRADLIVGAGPVRAAKAESVDSDDDIDLIIIGPSLAFPLFPSPALNP